MLLLTAAGAALVGCSDAAPSGPGSLRVVYRVTDSAQQPAVTTTVTVDDQPPYRGRTRTRSADGRDLGGAAWDEGHQYLLPPDGPARTVLDVPPGFAGTGHGLDVALASALHHGLVRRSGAARVAGRDCTEWQSKEPLDTGAFALPTETDRTTSCVTADGVLLRDSWVLHGKLVRTREATSVGRGPDLSGDRLLGGATPSPAPTSAAPEQVKVVDRLTLLRALAVQDPQPPQGFSPDRDAAVITLDPDGQVGTEGGVLTWTDGPRLLVLRLERGLTHVLSPPAVGIRVAVGRGSGRLVPQAYGLQLTFGTGSFVVTVRADLPEDELLAWAGSLPLPG